MVAKQNTFVGNSYLLQISLLFFKMALQKNAVFTHYSLKYKSIAYFLRKQWTFTCFFLFITKVNATAIFCFNLHKQVYQNQKKKTKQQNTRKFAIVNNTKQNSDK